MITLMMIMILKSKETVKQAQRRTTMCLKPPSLGFVNTYVEIAYNDEYDDDDYDDNDDDQDPASALSTPS